MHIDKKNRMRSVGSVFILLLLLTGCRHAKQSEIVIDKYLRVAIALGERDPDALDYYVGPKDLLKAVEKSPPTLSDIALQITQLQKELPACGMERARRDALAAQLNAMALRAQALQGRYVSFDAESRGYFDIEAMPYDKQQERVAIRKEIGERIGYGAGNYASYDARFIVSPKRVPAVMRVALAECRRLTLQHITMPPDESVELEYVVHKPWSAFSSYRGNNHSVIEVNLELPLTVDRLLDLACHEGYPGHHVFNTLRDQSVVKGMGFREGQVQLTFSPQSFVSEAAASYAPEIVLDEPTRIQIERNLLFPAAGLKTDDVERYIHVQRLVESLHSAEPGIAREYLDGRLEFVRALEALKHELLMEHGESTLLYLNEYRSYMLTYTVGKDLVERCVEQGAKEPVSRWMRYQKLMTQPENNLSYCAHHV